MTKCGNCGAGLDAGLVCANNVRSVTYRCERCDHENSFDKQTGALLSHYPTNRESR